MKHQMSTYLDIQELAEMLRQSPRTIRRHLAQKPYLVPPKMHMPNSQMLRWRACEVENWMFETGWTSR